MKAVTSGASPHRGTASGFEVPARPVQVLVEGPDEVAFLSAAFARSGDWTKRLQVQQCGGNGGFLAALERLTSMPGFRGQVTNVVVLADADESPGKAFADTADALDKAGLPRPVGPGVAASGRFDGFDLATRVILVPGDAATGCLETLFLASIADDVAFGCALQMLDCWKTNGVPLPVRVEKLLVQAWLAQHTRTGYTLLKASFDRKPMPWNLEHAAFAGLLAQLRAL